MKRIAFWEVSVMGDCEGKGPYKTLANFTTEDAAKSFASSSAGRDMYGRHGEVDGHEMVIFDSLDEASDDSREKALKRAYAKLSEEELEALKEEFMSPHMRKYGRDID